MLARTIRRWDALNLSLRFRDAYTGKPISRLSAFLWPHLALKERVR